MSEQIWKEQGQLHRLNGPAVISEDGGEEYWFMGLRHREDGPAIIRADGSTEYWLHGEHYSSKRQWKEALREQQYSGSAYHLDLTDK